MDEEYIDFNKFLIQEKKDKVNKEFIVFRKNSDHSNEGIVWEFNTMHSLKEYFKSAGITFPDESAPIKIKPKDEPVVQFSPIPEDEQAFIPDEPVNLV